MKSFTVTAPDAEKRLDRYAASLMPGLSQGLIQKYIRLKKLKINSKPGKADSRLALQDVVDIYLPDECFIPVEKPDRLYVNFKEHISVVYEDADALIINKKPGMVTHPDDDEKIDTLLTHARAYLYHKGEWSALKSDFAPIVCNRLDRFTSGLVIVAKNRESMDRINDAIRRRAVVKKYVCVCHSRPNPPCGEFRNYLYQSGAHVRVSQKPVPGGKLSITKYETLETRAGLSLVSLELETGRTHQIRAQMAYAGCPILGDPAYGLKDDARRYSRSNQALCAVSLAFEPGVIPALGDRTISVHAPFVADYFPNAKGF